MKKKLLPPVQRSLTRLKPILPWAGGAIGGILLTGVLFWGLLIQLPQKNVPPTVSEEAKRRADLVNSNRENVLKVIQTLAGLGFVATAILAWKNYQLTEDKNVTERFTRAVEMLADIRLEVRLGGIYALERIAGDSEEDLPVVVKILIAFMRDSRPSEAMKNGTKRNNDDIRSALEVVLKLMKNDIHDAKLHNADLAGAELIHVNLSNADLSNADLSNADLSQTSFLFAELQGAKLSETTLIGTSFLGSDLRGADLRRSNCFLNKIFDDAIPPGIDPIVTEELFTQIYTVFFRADLHRADLRDADLRYADFRDANLREAKLQGTDLRGAILGENVKVTAVDLEEAILCNTTLPDYLTTVDGDRDCPSENAAEQGGKQ